MTSAVFYLLHGLCLCKQENPLEKQVFLMVTVVCHECEQHVEIPSLAHRQRARCPRCNNLLTAYRRKGNDYALAFAISALIALAMSLPFDFLTFSASGQKHDINLPSGLAVLIQHDYVSLAVVTALATLVLPGLVLLGIALLMMGQKWGQPSPFLIRTHKWVQRLLPWSMAEIFLVGTLVSLIKITELADITLGLSFYAFIVFTLTLTATLLYYDALQSAIWLYDGDVPIPHSIDKSDASKNIQQTWALLLTAVLFYIPANALPIMETVLLGDSEPNTILGGVITLWQSGSYPVALVILVASVLVPMAKLLILIWLNLVVQTRRLNNPEKRIRYYRFTEWIGRWSMVDVFVVAILVALVQLGSTISIYPGPAAMAFCAVVFITMAAAMSFDSRLLWLQQEEQ